MNNKGLAFTYGEYPKDEGIAEQLKKEAMRVAKFTDKYFNMLLETQIKLFCKEHNCTIDDIAVYHQVTELGTMSFWVDYRIKKDGK